MVNSFSWIPIVGIVNNMEFQLATYSNKLFLMDTIIMDCLVKGDMLLSKKWATPMGGSIQMDLAYANIPLHMEEIKLHRENKMHIIENHYKANNEVLY